MAKAAPAVKATRSGIATCLVSADLYGGRIRIYGIRICKDASEAKRLLDEYEESGDGSYHGMFIAEPWMEESDRA